MLALAAAGALCAHAAEVKIDFGRPVGPVKRVNGVGQPPLVGKLASWPMLHYLKEAGIPYSRLHDVGGWLGGGLFVDIPNLFPNFDADENDPKSYRFAYTDSLMKALDENGVEPFFRLGVTIENFVERGYPPVNIMPPKDYAKWGRICEHVIRHYTEGWADGFKMKIAYWEIWNEPENHPEIGKNPMWRGDYSPLFNPLTYKPHKAYYAFTAFNELRKRGTAVAAQVSGDKNLWVAAAKGEKDAAVMMANDSDRAIPLTCDFHGGIVTACRITYKDRTDADVPMPPALPPRSFLVATMDLR